MTKFAQYDYLEKEYEKKIDAFIEEWVKRNIEF
jgi:hypothetical protein